MAKKKPRKKAKPKATKKPLRCSKCKRTFSLPAHLARHMASTHASPKAKAAARRKRAATKRRSRRAKPRRRASEVGLSELTVEELERGTFTISSLAKYDITYFTAIVNPPQSGILSVGKTREELSLVDGEIKVKKMTTLGLGVDHRIIDGAVAADFLQNLKWKLERPSFTFLTL